MADAQYKYLYILHTKEFFLLISSSTLLTVLHIDSSIVSVGLVYFLNSLNDNKCVLVKTNHRLWNC